MEQVETRPPAYGEFKVFTADGEEWVIARDAADASKAYEEHIGETLAAQTGEPEEWTEEPPGKVFKYRDESGRETVVTAKTCAEWAKEKGRGYFASANA